MCSYFTNYYKWISSNKKREEEYIDERKWWEKTGERTVRKSDPNIMSLQEAFLFVFSFGISWHNSVIINIYTVY